MAGRRQLPVRGYLLHITHYDPMWVARKARERPFHLDTALEIVEALAQEKFSLLVIDCADGVRYRSHPEIAKKYTAPMRHLQGLAAAARDQGIDVAPKLNFSQSRWHHHNDWMRDPGEPWYAHFDDDAYWRKAFELIDELVAACQPRRYFHIGMDEDHSRSHAQYIAAIKTLRSGLRERRLKTLVWNDSAIEYASGLAHAEKSLAAEKAVPKDVVQIIWRYDAVPASAIRRLARAKFEVWGAPGSRDPALAARFGNAVTRAGGKGLFMTTWRPVRKSARRDLLRGIRMMGPVYRGEIPG
jgi:hypothetical protein